MKSISKHSALNQPKYRGFVKQRDNILNKLYFDLQRKISTVLANTIYSVQQIYGKYYDDIVRSNFDYAVFVQQKKKLEDFLKLTTFVEQQILHLITTYRRWFWALAKGSEAESLGRVLPKKHRLNITRQDLWARGIGKTKQGQSLEAVIHIGLSRTLSRALEAFQTSYLQQYDHDKALDLFGKKMPKVKRKIKQLRQKEALRLNGYESYALKEADKTKKQTNQDTIKDMVSEYGSESSADSYGLSFTVGVIDESTFEEIRDAFVEEYIPTYNFRDERLKFEVPSADGSNQEIYGWQIENDITNDFVMQVRDGQNSAAKEAGITDFIWLVTRSEATCECCAWRDGLTSSEIESKLTEMGDDCDDEVVPPAHPNCYCTISPYSESIAEYEKETPTIGSADEWLNELANQLT